MNRPALDSFWIPFTSNREFKADPRMIVSAKGMYYQSEDGRDILDGTAGLWCCNAGHSHPKIVEAISKSVATLDYAPNFQFGHPGAFELSARLADAFPEHLNHFFFANSGSEAVDSALKIALAYQRARGKGSKTRLIGRERGYHGVGFGGISVGGIVKNRMYFGNLIAGVDHLRHTHDPARNAYSRGEVEFGVERAEDLLGLIQLHDASNIAAVIVEPVAGSTGVLPPPKGYLQRLRQICDEHDILLIFDEVITGFGRLGEMTAAQYFGVEPDLITFAKGVTSGVIPLGGVAVRDEIYETMLEGADAPIELFHGYTYSGHPLATAAALACLDIYETESLFSRVREQGAVLEEKTHQLKGANHIIDIRTIGLIAGIELAPDPDRPGARGFEVMKKSWQKGLMVRVTGDTLALSPPFIVTPAQIEDMLSILTDILSEIE
ncbi:MAG TPA: aspartate aminotransferase family protein [Gammaproteobacteria bacterium]|jgi:beta-alanine--pyruvate transaminase|nr:aspartate aminotransferase family protein [Gammaproteobacteria bacterium]